MIPASGVSGEGINPRCLQILLCFLLPPLRDSKLFFATWAPLVCDARMLCVLARWPLSLSNLHL